MKNIAFILITIVLLSMAAFADTVEMKNGYEIEAPIVLDKHGYFGDEDATPEAVPEGKVRLKYENGYMDIPKYSIKMIRRTEE